MTGCMVVEMTAMFARGTPRNILGMWIAERSMPTMRDMRIVQEHQHLSCLLQLPWIFRWALALILIKVFLSLKPSAPSVPADDSPSPLRYKRTDFLYIVLRDLDHLPASMTSVYYAKLLLILSRSDRSITVYKPSTDTRPHFQLTLSFITPCLLHYSNAQLPIGSHTVLPFSLDTSCRYDDLAAVRLETVNLDVPSCSQDLSNLARRLYLQHPRL